MVTFIVLLFFYNVEKEEIGLLKITERKSKIQFVSPTPGYPSLSILKYPLASLGSCRTSVNSPEHLLTTLQLAKQFAIEFHSLLI